MLIYFSVKNFRSVKDTVTLSFEPQTSQELEQYYIIEPIEGVRLLKLGLIYGSNGSGKTTLLKALNFLRRLVIDPSDKKNESFDYSPFLFDELTPLQDSGFEIAFVADGVKYVYEINFNKSFVSYEALYFYSPNKSLVFKRTTDSEKKLATIEFGSKIKIKKHQKDTLEANTLWNNTVLGGFVKTNIESAELKNTTEWFQNVLKPMVAPKTNLFGFVSGNLESERVNKNTVIELLKKADFKIHDIVIEQKDEPVSQNILEIMKVLSKQSTSLDDSIRKIEEEGKVSSREILFEHVVINEGKESKYRLPYKEESQGTQRYYQFSGLLDIMLREQTVFPIDELESSLHPDLIRHFLLIFLVNAKSSQLITTTHHRELLMEKDILREDVIWFVEKKDNGSMDLYSLSDFDSSVVRNTTSIFNAYKSGKLGAIPTVSDYYLDVDNGKE